MSALFFVLLGWLKNGGILDFNDQSDRKRNTVLYHLATQHIRDQDPSAYTLRLFAGRLESLGVSEADIRDGIAYQKAQRQKGLAVSFRLY